MAVSPSQSDLDIGSHISPSLSSDRKRLIDASAGKELALSPDNGEDEEYVEPMAMLPSLSSLGSRRSESSQSSEFAGERNDNENEGEPNLFVYFGKPQPTNRTDCPPMFGTTHEVVLDYLDEHNLEMLLEHLLALCLIRMPEDPYAFMAEHCGNMVAARTDPQKCKELARVFCPQHVNAMFRVFDKEQNGHISMSQYQFAMQAFGLRRYTLEPKGYKTDTITEETFVREACHALEAVLESFMS